MSHKRKTIVLPHSSESSDSSPAYDSENLSEDEEEEEDAEFEDIDDSSEASLANLPDDPIEVSDQEDSINWPKRRKYDIRKGSDSDEEQLFKLPNCPICLGPLSMPVVDTDCCGNQMCESCVVSCVAGGADYSDGPKCPVCRHNPFIYTESTVFNRLLGQQEVACTNAAQGCGKFVALSDMQQHIDKYCNFAVLRCAQDRFGCPWTGYRKEKEQHEKTCNHVENAKVIEAYQEKKRELEQQMSMLAKNCTSIETRIDTAIHKFNGEVKRRLAELKHMQETHIDNLAQGYVIVPRPAERPLQVRRMDASYSVSSNMLMYLGVTVENDECVLSVLAKNVKLRYPFWIAGYVVCLNKAVDVLNNTKHFHYRFGTSKDVMELMRVPKKKLELGIGESGKRQIEPIALQILISAFSN